MPLLARKLICTIFLQFHVYVHEGLLDCHAHCCTLIFRLLLLSVIERVPTERADDTVCMSGLKCCTLKACNIWGGAGLLWQRWVGRTVVGGKKQGFHPVQQQLAGETFFFSLSRSAEMRRAQTQRRSRGCWWITIGMPSHHEPQAFSSRYQLMPLVSLIEARISVLGWFKPVVRRRNDCSRLGCATQDRGDLRRHRSCSPVRGDFSSKMSFSFWMGVLMNTSYILCKNSLAYMWLNDAFFPCCVYFLTRIHLSVKKGFVMASVSDTPAMCCCFRQLVQCVWLSAGAVASCSCSLCRCRVATVAAQKPSLCVWTHALCSPRRVKQHACGC